jgi:hypothetical protein
MKRSILSFTLAGLVLFLLQSHSPVTKSPSQIPDDVNKLLKASCYDCHSTDARGKDAKEALDFKKWNDYRLTKKIGLLGDISKLVEQNKMPPEKYLTNKPDRKLSEDQKTMIIDWAEKESNKLMGNN